MREPTQQEAADIKRCADLLDRAFEAFRAAHHLACSPPRDFSVSEAWRMTDGPCGWMELWCELQDWTGTNGWPGREFVKPRQYHGDVFLNEVFRAMQPMEELGGPTGVEYVKRMRAIAEECLARIENYSHVVMGPSPDAVKLGTK